MLLLPWFPEMRRAIATGELSSRKEVAVETSRVEVIFVEMEICARFRSRWWSRRMYYVVVCGCPVLSCHDWGGVVAAAPSTSSGGCGVAVF